MPLLRNVEEEVFRMPDGSIKGIKKKKNEGTRRVVVVVGAGWVGEKREAELKEAHQEEGRPLCIHQGPSIFTYSTLLLKHWPKRKSRALYFFPPHTYWKLHFQFTMMLIKGRFLAPFETCVNIFKRQTNLRCSIQTRLTTDTLLFSIDFFSFFKKCAFEVMTL